MTIFQKNYKIYLAAGDIFEFKLICLVEPFYSCTPKFETFLKQKNFNFLFKPSFLQNLCYSSGHTIFALDKKKLVTAFGPTNFKYSSAIAKL